MPKFDAMDMVVCSKGVIGFNLSFFANEHDLIREYMRQIIFWLENGQLKVGVVKHFVYHH